MKNVIRQADLEIHAYAEYDVDESKVQCANHEYRVLNIDKNLQTKVRETLTIITSYL